MQQYELKLAVFCTARNCSSGDIIETVVQIMIKDLPFDIQRLHAAYTNGIEAADVIAEAKRRLELTADPGIFLHLIPDAELQADINNLGAFDPVSKPLWGIPFAIKDNIDSAGAPTTAACPAYTYEADANAFAVEVLRNAGALLIGKTNLDQFATGLVGVRSPHPIPKNAVDTDLVPGGSSSGSAVATAHGIVSFALGTDTAGSGRVPAALNRIVGLKPSLGSLSNTGVVPACRTLDTISIFALTVEDAYRVFQIAAEYDDTDAYARVTSRPPLGPPPPSFRVGIPNATSRIFFGDDVQEASFKGAIDQLSTLGADIVELDYTPFYDVAEMLYAGAWAAERLTVIEDMLRTRPEEIHPTTRQVIGFADGLSAADAFRGFYKLQELKRLTGPLIESVDFLCVPTIPTFYSRFDLEADPIGPNSRLGTYTNFVNLLDMCGIAVPVEDRSDGLPGSITLLAPAGRDNQIAAVANTLFKTCNPKLGATGWSLPEPETQGAAAVNADEIAVAVVGAHMSGLPLNSELTSLDARFMCKTKTAASYRLFSLAGGPPKRPGLIFDESGAAIDLEIWALPSAHFGDFLKGIPRPLGIGSVKLENGTTVNSFICEPYAMADAEDVTRFGGWRNYLQTL